MKFDAIKLCPTESGYSDSLRKTPFWIVKVTFQRVNPFDRSILRSILADANILSQKVNPKSANDSVNKRHQNRLLANATAGILSEYCWKNAINLLSAETIVTETTYEHGEAQIDLVSLKQNSKIEIRSSFPRNGIEFALFHPEHRFDILGPYSNAYKPSEIAKDFYLRALYHFHNSDEFMVKYETANDLEIFLTGGATQQMMYDEKVAVSKRLIPEDSLHEEESSYRVIPFEHALDTIEIIKAIKHED